MTTLTLPPLYPTITLTLTLFPQYARVMGMRVVAVDVGMAKSKQCLDLGAEAFVDAR